nr:polyprenyl synthetase family protein [uncultured Friedmanniella sp.]
MTPNESGSATSATLAHYSAVTRAAILEHLAEDQPAPYLGELVGDYPSRGGKGLRPALLLATCQAYGRRLEEALPAAASLEMMHNAFLIHDDVEDASRTRRGAPTLHEMHGIALAVNAGDALAQRALQPLQAPNLLGSRITRRPLAELRMVVRQATEGQALELGWRRDGRVDLTDSDYLALAGKKTCWYTTIAPLRMGSIIGSAGTAELSALSRFGFYLGLAFQIRDDLMDLQPGPGQSGSDGFPDIAEGKPTLMLIHLLCHADDRDRSWLVGYLQGADRGSGDEERVLALMQRYGSLTYVREYAAQIESAAVQAFEQAFADVPGSSHRTFVRDLVPYMLARTT